MFTLGQSKWINPSLAWKKADIFKINGDDDEVGRFLYYSKLRFEFD